MANAEIIFCAENVMKINKIINDYFAYYSKKTELKKSHGSVSLNRAKYGRMYCLSVFHCYFEFEKHSCQAIYKN
jgi:hypothetical protein